MHANVHLAVTADNSTFPFFSEQIRFTVDESFGTEGMIGGELGRCTMNMKKNNTPQKVQPSFADGYKRSSQWTIEVCFGPF